MKNEDRDGCDEFYCLFYLFLEVIWNFDFGFYEIVWYLKNKVLFLLS